MFILLHHKICYKTHIEHEMNLKIKVKPADAAVLSYIVQQISGPDKSDQTIFYWESGSISRTSPATPKEFRGDKVFREIRHLPPEKNYKGKMLVNRQRGEVKSIVFE